ncbi:MAG: leucyl aminopeptidase [Jhaorihella sp.]
MSSLTPIRFEALDLDRIATASGRVAVIVSPDGRMDRAGRRANRLTRGALKRLIESERFSKMKSGKIVSLAWPGGMAAEALDVLVLAPNAPAAEARKAGAELARVQGGRPLLLLTGNRKRVAELGLGFVLRAYRFDAHKTPGEDDDDTAIAEVCIAHARPDEAEAEFAPLLAVAEGVHMTRDLVNEPANVLGTAEFARRVDELKKIGLDVEILEERELEKLGMAALLAVGQGSASPSKVAVMQWKGGAKDAPPLALIGKGVVFDTGGISLKPAAGMEDMTMDMGGAAVVVGTMAALARRKARANVVGLVGLVENMPSGTATRPGDVVKSMKGDTIEVINTDAEGRLVLCDVMWYAQDRFKPAAMIDLATLTGAIIIGLGHEKAGVFSNDDGLSGAFLRAAGAESEGAWRMPLDKAYDEMLKSRIADMKNVGGRPAGSITAAQFLQRFVKEGTPWIHLDIAGVASVKTDTDLAPKGATGWGVLSLNRLVADRYESKEE